MVSMIQEILSQERKEKIIKFIGRRAMGQDLVDIHGVLFKREIPFQALRMELDVMASQGILGTEERLIKERKRLATFYSLGGRGLEILRRIQQKEEMEKAKGGVSHDTTVDGRVAESEQSLVEK